MAEHTLQVMDVAPDGPGYIEHCPRPGHGHGPYSDVFVCGRCGIVLIRDSSAGVPHSDVIRCLNCGACNQMPRQNADGTGTVRGRMMP